MTFAVRPIGIGMSPGGQVEYSTATTATWTVPVNVSSICVVCVGAPYADGATPLHATLKRGGTTLIGSNSPLSGGVGGGNGGVGGSPYVESYANPQPGEFSRYDHLYFSGGGGGAGGYTGSGGAGGAARLNFDGATYGGSGTGGGGGGGRGTPINGTIPSSYSQGSPGSGGGVGLRGSGASGTGGATDGTSGSLNIGGQPTPGGGSHGVSSSSISISGNFPDAAKISAARGFSGGDLRYLNDIAVTPGESLSVSVPSGGGLRIIWGAARSYPSNAADR